jgi:hypothetical protein
MAEQKRFLAVRVFLNASRRVQECRQKFIKATQASPSWY